MAERQIYVDKSEIVLLVPAKNKMKRYNLAAGDVNRIQFDKSANKILGFIKSETETITVTSGKVGTPMVYKKNQNKKYFDEYKRELERFAKDNYVTFADNTKDLVE